MTAALTDHDTTAPAGGLVDHLNATAAPAAPAPERRQAGALVELLVEGEQPYTVRIGNRERIAFEKAAARHKEWPAISAGQHFAMTFCCWAAAKRAGRTTATFEQFQELLEDYDVLSEAPADPTR